MDKLFMTESQIENFVFSLFEIYSRQIGTKIILRKKGE